MRDEFLAIAKKILSQLEDLFSEAELKEDYVYKKIPQLVDEVKTLKFSKSKTDIGLAAIRLLDMGFYEDEKLVSEIVRLDELYRLMQKPAARI
jgi:hypothetical protein